MPTLKTLNELFNNTLFRIPDYQRGYAWTPSQLKDFWDDLHNLSEGKSHYTGVLTVKEVPTQTVTNGNWNDERWLLEDRGYKAYYVVDGQQRLTTSVIFIQALVEVLVGLPENEDQPKDKVYLGTNSLKSIEDVFVKLAKPPHNIINSYKFGYESDNPSFRFLRHRIFGEPNGGTINETFYTLNLENAKRFFVQKLKGAYEDEKIEGLASLYRKLTVFFKFNLYEIEDDFDVFVAFETMNNRGKKLSNLELLKNRLIYLTTLYEPHEIKDDDRRALRDKIDEAWKEVYYQLGRNKTHPLNDDEFLNAHWIMYFPYSRQNGRDYINFLLNEKFTPRNVFEKQEIPVSKLEDFEILRDGEQIEEAAEEDEANFSEDAVLNRAKLKPKELEDYVGSLKAAAVHWYNTYNPVNNPEISQGEGLWIDKLNRLGIAYFRPLITAAFLRDDLSSNERVSLFKEIERFIFIAFRLNRSYATYRNSEFYRAARQLLAGDATISSIVQLLKDRLDFAFPKYEDGEAYFDPVLFQKYINKNFTNGGGFYWWNGLKYFLYEYEMERVSQRGNQKLDWQPFVKSDGDKISIEHILPQTPSKSCWKQMFKGVSAKNLNYLQGSLGNLVPLSKSINSSLQNDCFDAKKQPKHDESGQKIREGYNDGSHSEIEVAQCQHWTPKEIAERGLNLLRFMERRWDIEFANDQVMMELLGLKFMNNS